MTSVPEQLVHDVAARVARRVTSGDEVTRALPPRYVLLVLSGSGGGLGEAISRLAEARDPVVAVLDCPTASAGALAAARSRIPSLLALSGEEASGTDTLISRADRLVAPALDLALASRVAALQADTPGSRAILRALFRGVPVEATLDEREFQVSERAPAGARRAVSQIEARLSELGLALAPGPGTGTFAAANGPRSRTPGSGAFATGGSGSPSSVYGAGRPHPSQERFGFPESVNEFVEFLERRACIIEPDKPCVNCGACETRGF